MVPVVRISQDNFEALQTWAEPIVDSADDALSKILEAAEQYRESVSVKCESARDAVVEQSQYDNVENKVDLGAENTIKEGRLPRGSKIPEWEYERPILEAVYELGGKARMSEVLTIVERKMRHLLTSVDYERLPSGNEVRWRNTAQWARNTLVHNKGLLKKNAGHGIWELTERGVAEVENGFRS